MIALATLVSTTTLLEASCSWAGCSSSKNGDAPKQMSKQEAAALKAQGGVVYEEYGTAWHAIRYRTEFTAAQWKTILLQKRVRVPLTADDQRALSKLFVGE